MQLSRLFTVLASFGFLAVLAYSVKDMQTLIVPGVTMVSEDASRSPILFQRISEDWSKKLEHIVGQPIWKVSVSEIHDALASDSRLESFRVKRSFPNNIEISLLAKRPLAALLIGSENLFPIAADGSLLPRVKTAASPDLPIVRGVNKTQTEKIQQVVRVLGEVPVKGDFSLGEVSEVVVAKDDEISLVLNGDGIKVLLGKKMSKIQAERIGQVLKYLRSRSIKGRVIDARFSKKVVVRVRKAS